MSIHSEIQDMFRLYQATFDKAALYNDKNQQSYQNLHRGQIGSPKAPSAAWKMFRCYADEDCKSGRFPRFCKAVQMLSSGLYSCREVQRETQFSINTVCRLMHRIRAKREREGKPEIKCPCGTPIVSHRGWCAHRLANSTARQEFLKSKWNIFL